MTIPVRLAQSSYESGPMCLAMLLAGRGVFVGQETLRVACGVGRDGTDLHDLQSAAEQVGAQALILTEPIDTVPLPAVIRWSPGLLRIVESRHGSTWHLIDPFEGRLTCSDAEIHTAYSGSALILENVPTSGIEGQLGRIRRWREVLGKVTSILNGSYGGVAFVVLAGLALIAPGLLTPALIRQFVDTYLSAGDSTNAAVLVGGLIGALVVQVALIALQISGLGRLVGATDVRQTALFVWHVLRMPAWFYEQRDATTVGYRVRLNEEWANVLSGRLTAALLAQMTSIFYLIVMIIFSPILAAIAALGLAMGFILTWRVARLRSEVRQRQARERAVLATQLGVSLRMLETLKATGSEDIAFARVYGALGRSISLGNTSLWAYLAMVPILATTLTTAVVLGMGAALVMAGTLTLGTLTAFTLLLAGFLAPLAVIIPSLDSALNLRGAWEQLDDVLAQPPDPSLWDPAIDGPAPDELSPGPFRSMQQASTRIEEPSPSEEESVDDLSAIIQGASRRKRRGLAIDPWAATLRLEDVSFNYTPGRPPQLRDINLDVPAGRMVAIVGKSGSGKSTLGRLIAGLYRPTSGAIYLDGRSLRDFGPEERSRELAFVDQDLVAYQATVRENLTMFDPTISDRDVITAARDAHIHDDIVARPGGYDALLSEDGRNLSGGQRQRLVIARALVRQPRLIVLDEATSALDARTESDVIDRLRGRGCTIVLVAHRLSTVRDAEHIIVIDNGGVVETGTHTSLSRDGTIYRELMSS
jgi:ABC-type bacteriocin/lantibiotic exporter with double-glycine peptidase domain